MIYYSTDNWRTQIFRFSGTVWSRGVWWKVILITGYTAMAYHYCAERGADLGDSRKNTLGATLSFLLVFRANNAYKRYMQGRTFMTQFFCDLRELVSLGIIHMPGGDHFHRWRWRQHFRSQSDTDIVKDSKPDQCDKIVSEERTHVIRWALVLAICFQMHARLLDEGFNHGFLERDKKWLVDWDRYRMRHLLTSEEFAQLDKHTRQLSEPDDIWADLPLEFLDECDGLFEGGPPRTGVFRNFLTTMPFTRPCVLVIYKLNEILFGNMNDFRLQNRRYGVSERFVPSFGKVGMRLLTSFQFVTQCVSTPLPFPYFHLCKTLLFLYFLCFPFFIKQSLGVWANVCEMCCLSLALLGVDAIATELENPFGDDDNDLDIYEKISTLEHEILYFLRLCNDKDCQNNFTWIDMPPVISQASVSPIKGFLALRAQVEGMEGVIYGTETSREGLIEDVEGPGLDDDASSASGSS